jgi:hypothetical protein
MRLSLARSAERAELVENAFTMRSGATREAAVRMEASMTFDTKETETNLVYLCWRPTLIMSRHRHVRNINIHDELEDDALSDGGGYDMTPEQQGMTSVTPRSPI